MVDPSGTVPNRTEISDQKEIDPKYNYSCHCGWIDWRHANPQITAVKVLAQVGDALDFFRQNPQERFVAIRGKDIQHEIGVPGLGAQDTFTRIVVLTSELNENNWLNVAMALFREVEWAHENSRWSHLGAIAPNWTQFSEEDLASDLIAFYRALDEQNFDPAHAFAVLAPICGYPNEFDKCKQWSLDVYDMYGSFHQVGAWESPRLISTPKIDSYCSRYAARKWPTQLQSIQPEYSDRILINNIGDETGIIWEIVKKGYGSLNASGMLTMLSPSQKLKPPYIGGSVLDAQVVKLGIC